MRDVYPERRTLGSALHYIIENLPQYIYQRGAQIFSDLMWEIAGKKPRIRQLVLTSSDYCKLYLTILSFHTRRPSSSVPIDCGEEYVYVPLTVGVISRTPYLTFPKIFLSHMYHAFTSSSADQEQLADLLSRSIGDILHGVPVPLGSSNLTIWNVPRLDDSCHNQLQLYMAECGLEGSPSEEARPIPSAFNRGFSEVDIVALFDLLSLETILSTLNALVLEQKVLIISSQYSSSFIAHLCEAFRVLMYPFDWQHVFIPLIPAVAKDSLIDPSSGTPRVPLWIDSALTSDHIHPLRFLEAPAPLFGGLRVRPGGSTTLSIHSILRQLFTDLNIVDLDSDAFFLSSQRVDRVSCPLPPFPRKLAQLVTDRLSPLADWLCVGGKLPSGSVASAKARLERYKRWDEVLSSDLFHRGNMQVSSADSSVVGSFRRRSSLVRSAAGSRIASLAYRNSGSSRTWLKTTFSRRNSSSGSSTPGETLQEPDMMDLVAPCQIQAAVMEAFVRVFYPYRDYMYLDPMLRSTSGLGQSFVGSDRHFASEYFVKSFEKISSLGAETVAFAKSFIHTQCWDLFVRTTALNPVCHVFDTACAFYSVVNKTDYIRFKQQAASSAAAVASDKITLVGAPQAVLNEVELRYKPCPLNKKPKEHFFEQLIALIHRQHHIQTLMISEASESDSLPCMDLSPKLADEVDEQTPKLDVVDILTFVLTDDLPNKFSDANTESAKLVSLALERPMLSSQDVVNIKECFCLIQEGRMESHLIHAVVESLCHGIGGTVRRTSPRSARKVSANIETGSQQQLSNQYDDSVSLWSSKSKPFMKNSGAIDDSKLLGGIPRAVLSARAPQAPPYLLRKWGDQSIRSIRFLFKIPNVSRIDYHCTSCGASKSLLEVLREGRYADFSTNTDVEFVTALCSNCDALVCPELVPVESLLPAVSLLGHVRILKLQNLLNRLRESNFPLSVDLYLNLCLLLGLQAELYTGQVIEGVEKRQLRGLVPFSELVNDFLSCTVGEASEDGGGLSPANLAVVPTPLRSGGADSEVVSPRSVASSSSSEEQEETKSVASSKSDAMPESPRERALWRVRQYRKLMREKEKRKQIDLPGVVNILNTNLSAKPSPQVLRIHVDSPEQRAVFSPTTRNSRRPGPTPSPPAPPSERRPADAAPRRVRQSGTPVTASPNQSGIL